MSFKTAADFLRSENYADAKVSLTENNSSLFILNFKALILLDGMNIHN